MFRFVLVVSMEVSECRLRTKGTINCPTRAWQATLLHDVLTSNSHDHQLILIFQSDNSRNIDKGSPLTYTAQLWLRIHHFNQIQNVDQDVIKADSKYFTAYAPVTRYEYVN